MLAAWSLLFRSLANEIEELSSEISKFAESRDFLPACTSEKLQEKPSTGQKGEVHFHMNQNKEMTLGKKNPSILKGHWLWLIISTDKGIQEAL